MNSQRPPWLDGADQAGIEARWRRIDAVLQRGYVDAEGAVSKLHEAGLVRKAIEVPTSDGHVLWVFESDRHNLVAGPRLLLAREAGRGYGAIGGRLFRPISDVVRYDQGLFSVEFPAGPLGEE